MTSCIGVLHDVANRRTNTPTCLRLCTLQSTWLSELRQAAALHYTTKLCKLHDSFSCWTTVCRHVILNSYGALVMASELSQLFINAKKHTGSKGYKKGMVAVASQPQCHQQNTHDSYSSTMTTVTVAAWWCTHTHARTHARMHERTHARTHACMNARTHACMHERTHARMHAWTHARTHARTHTHTHLWYTKDKHAYEHTHDHFPHCSQKLLRHHSLSAHDTYNKCYIRMYNSALYWSTE